MRGAVVKKVAPLLGELPVEPGEGVLHDVLSGPPPALRTTSPEGEE